MDKEGSFDVIRRHLYEDEAIELTMKQKECLDRWNYVIELRTCEMLDRKEIVAKLMERFGIERATAFNDVNYGFNLFGYSITINKRFRIGARIDFLEQYIEELRAGGEHKAAAMQEANLIKWYEAYPDQKVEGPRKLRFSYSSNKPLSDDLPDIEDATYTLMQAAKNE